jgi:serine/threonine protein kinase/tetratricopeptide (TPR) repeat protein
MAADESHDDRTQSFVALTKGTMVSHYRIVEKIGAGGMGEVYLAEDTELRRQVALKFLPYHLCQDEDCRKRFKREAQATAGLDHPNIVPVYEVGEFQGRPFFAMAHLEGQPLRDVIKQGKLSVSEAITLAMQVCEGLHKAHESGVVHRDIKPSNIIIDNEGRARILDFGLATVSGEEKLTKTGSTLGTAGYMSPEQADGRAVDQRSDLFSLGVILYEMITGKRPFDRESDIATSKAIVTDTAEPLARYRAEVPDELQQIVDRALEKNIETRYPNAAAMLTDLKRLTQSSSVVMTTSVPVSRSRKIGWAVAISLAIVVAVWGGLQMKDRLAPGEMQVKSLAVVDFDNIGSDEDAYLASGLAEDLAVKLRQLEGFNVASSADIRRLSNENLLPREIASRLKVQYALGGSLLREDTLIRVNVELIDKETGNVVWSEQIDKQFTEIFQFMDEVSRKIADALEVRLTEVDEAVMAAKHTENTEAYDYYLKGRHYYYRVTFRDNELAAREFEKALHLDPDYKLALAGLADAYVQRYKERFDYDEFWLDSADVLINRALEIDPKLAEAYESRAEVLYEKECYVTALEAANTSKELRPDLDEPYVRLGEIYQRRGEFSKALEMYNKAIAIRPSVDAMCGKGEILVAKRDVDSAEVAYLAAIECNPDHDRGYRQLGDLYYDIDSLPQAEVMYSRAIEVRPDRGVNYKQMIYFQSYADTVIDVIMSSSEKLVTDFVQKYPYSWDAYELLNWWGLFIGNYSESVAAVEQAVKNNPDRVWSYLLLAENHAFGMTSSEYNVDKAAIENINFALKLRPNSSRVLKTAGNIYHNLNDNERALDYYEKALNLNPGSANILSLTANLLVTEGQYDSAVTLAYQGIKQAPGIINPSRHAQDCYSSLKKAMIHLQKPEEYLRVLEDATSKYSQDNPDFLEALANEQRLQGIYKEAVETYKLRLAVRRDIEPLRNLGLTHWLMDDTDNALDVFKEAHEINHYYWEAENWIIILLKYLGRFDEIDERYKIIKEREHQFSGFFTTDYYWNMCRFDEALDEFLKMANGGIYENDGWLCAIGIYIEKGELDKARQVLKDHNESFTGHWMSWADQIRTNLAEIEGDLTQAQLIIKKQLEFTMVTDEDDVAHLAKLQFATGQKEQALNTMTQIKGPAARYPYTAPYVQAQLEISSGSSDSLVDLKRALLFASRASRSTYFRNLAPARIICAQASARLGYIERAIEDIEFVLRLEPESRYVPYGAACVYSIIGDTTLALQWLETTVERGYQELWWAKVDPDLDPLRELPRFKEIMENWDTRIKAMVAKSGKSQ